MYTCKNLSFHTGDTNFRKGFHNLNCMHFLRSLPALCSLRSRSIFGSNFLKSSSEIRFEQYGNAFGVFQFLCDVDEQLVPNVGMTFNTLEEAGQFYKDYSKLAEKNEIKNQLITCSREEKWKSNIPLTHKTNPSARLNCPVILHHSYPCCPNQAEMLKQHRQLSMLIRRTIENNDEARIRPRKIYQTFVAAAGAFDRNWNDFLMKYNIGDNKWLLELFEDRHLWIPIYLNHHFWDRMRSTQRSEIMHAFFKNFIMCNSSPIQFVK
ncbi:hypothetical protein Ahy_B05g074814 [Arachis hypogaea]|uniref:Protein FAR1-RELATED SEQUENCE n=1 Tax=Arachis hypogaea TaxID=3818 RepID=A0A444YZX0_ARAHY|nr:hypothetical protein Ahy_B05g074814 [Arachis hypogaea]